METNTRDMISMSEFSRKPSAVVNDLPAHGHRVIVRNNQPVGVLMSMEEADRLDEVREDMQLMAMAMVRMASDDGVRYSLSEVIAEFGLDEAELMDEGETGDEAL